MKKSMIKNIPKEIPPIGVTRFMDMHSGGGAKIYRDDVPQEYIYIEAPEKLGVTIFKELYDRNPDHVTCNCCGSDYSVCFDKDIVDATGYERGCDYDKLSDAYIEKPRFGQYISLEEYLKKPNVTFIPWSEAKMVLGIPDQSSYLYLKKENNK